MRSARYVGWANALVGADGLIEVVEVKLEDLPQARAAVRHMKRARASLEKAVTDLGRLIVDPPDEAPDEDG